MGRLPPPYCLLLSLIHDMQSMGHVSLLRSHTSSVMDMVRLTGGMGPVCGRRMVASAFFMSWASSVYLQHFYAWTACLLWRSAPSHKYNQAGQRRREGGIHCTYGCRAAPHGIRRQTAARAGGSLCLAVATPALLTREAAVRRACPTALRHVPRTPSANICYLLPGG